MQCLRSSPVCALLFPGHRYCCKEVFGAKVYVRCESTSIDVKSWWLASRRSALALGLIDAFEDHVVLFTVNSYTLYCQDPIPSLWPTTRAYDRGQSTISRGLVVDRDTLTQCDHPNLTPCHRILAADIHESQISTSYRNGSASSRSGLRCPHLAGSDLIRPRRARRGSKVGSHI